jgi:hypothetical protein
VVLQMSDDPRIFLSSSRMDAEYTALLRRRIEEEQLSPWQGTSHMEGGKGQRCAGCPFAL